ncbi:hypothetical protein INT44_004593 [Umbelopsis vinacea]|uniref:Hamartin n=1 Tax=Umbelopsis vinacea TaxID=44442 RepID=A0A8H7QDI6_9FUNG|nr:hypothetical protein INT44_004593 [Umbelopsis vinacea]
MVSLKEIGQAIASALRSTPQNDAQEVLDLIDLYLDQQRSQPTATPSFGDPGAIDKLSAELLHILKTEILADPTVTIVSIQPVTTKVQTKHYVLLRIVHQLLPVFGVNRILNDWWPNALKPVLQNSHYSKSSKDESIKIAADALILEDQNSESIKNNVFLNLVINDYLQWSNRQQQDKLEALEALDMPSEVDDTSRMKSQHQTLLDQEQDEWSKNLSAIMVAFGTARTKSFFLLVEDYFIQSQYRLQIIYLISAFIPRKRTHIHDILQTPLFDSMLKSLMYDNSTTLIAISVTNLIMLLPRICAYLSPFLPKLFYIFARAVCWDQLRDFRQNSGSTQDASLAPREASSKNIQIDGWDVLDYTFSKLAAPPSNPRTGAFFTSLYGLYPCNFTSFLHAPYAYFGRNEFNLPEQFDEDTFRSRIIPQVNRHMLHPNLVVMDASTELVDHSRWMKLEPPDVMAQIMSLDLTNAASRVAFNEENSSTAHITSWLFEEQVRAEAAGGSKDVKSEPVLTRPHQDKVEDPPINAPTQNQNKKMKAVSIANVLNVHKALKSGAEVVVGDDVWESGLEHWPSSAEGSPNPDDMTVSEGAPTPAPNYMMAVEDGTSSSEQKLLIAALKREVLLLRNELNFEMFLKQQHLQHIGRLHREHVMDISVEAERQQMYNATRMLQQQLQRTTTALDKLKAENATTKVRHIEWEEEQSKKLRDYREQRKQWQMEMAKAREQVAEFETILKVQDGQLEQARKRVFDLESELEFLRPTLVTVQEYETEIDQLTKQLALWEQDTGTIKTQKQYIETLLSRWQATENILESYRESEQAAKATLSKMQLKYNEMEATLSKIEQFNEKKALISSKELASSQQSEVQKLRQKLESLLERNETLELEKLDLQAKLEHTSHDQS